MKSIQPKEQQHLSQSGNVRTTFCHVEQKSVCHWKKPALSGCQQRLEVNDLLEARMHFATSDWIRFLNFWERDSFFDLASFSTMPIATSYKMEWSDWYTAGNYNWKACLHIYELIELALRTLKDHWCSWFKEIAPNPKDPEIGLTLFKNQCWTKIDF